MASDTAVKDELIDTIEQSYYKKVPRKDLETASLKGIVASLGDRFSQYLTPAESKSFNSELNGGEFAGVGVSVVPERRGLLVTNVILGMMIPGIDNSAHLGGLFAGVLLTWASAAGGRETGAWLARAMSKRTC